MKIEIGNGGLSLSEIAALTGGVLGDSDGTLHITHIATDSREVTKGTLFLGIRGERVDGNKFFESAVENGASAVMGERTLADAPSITVDDTVEALGRLAKTVLGRHAVHTVAVTGSVGKTTTKELLKNVLEMHFETHASKGNYNSSIGLPMSVLEMNEGAEAAVFELGMSAPMEIDYLSRLVAPEIALITNVGTSHMESLGSRENIAKAKLEIINGMEKGGTVLLRRDEPLLTAAEGAILEKGLKPVYVAVSEDENIPFGSDFTAMNVRTEIGKTIFDLSFGSTVIRDLTLNVMGVHTVYAATFAAAVGILLGVSEEEIREGLSHFRAAPMRQSIETIAGVTVIEDCYNASPESMRAALDVAETIAKRQGSGKVLALLGDMRELGETSDALHREVGAYAARKGVSELFTFGPESSRYTAEGAEAGGIPEKKIHREEDPENFEAVTERIRSSIGTGDVLLVKASRALRAERVVACLKGI